MVAYVDNVECICLGIDLDIQLIAKFPQSHYITFKEGLGVTLNNSVWVIIF